LFADDANVASDVDVCPADLSSGSGGSLRDYTTGTSSEHQSLKCMDYDNASHHSYLCMPPGPVPHSDDICRSLVDTSQHPTALNDAICMYIDYLTRDNDRVTGDFPTALGLPIATQPHIGTRYDILCSFIAVMVNLL